MFRKLSEVFGLLILVVLLCVGGCQQQELIKEEKGKCQADTKSAKSEKKDGPYGFTSKYRAFPSEWYEYYETGLSFAEGCHWDKAVDYLNRAIELRHDDQWRARTYGRHFIDYFPNRELGIAYYFMGRFDDSVEELEVSLSQTPTAKALLYLERAYYALLDQKEANISYPKIVLNELWTREDPVFLSGNVKDRKYIKLINVEGLPVFLLNSFKDLKKDVNFNTQLSLSQGVHTIKVEVENIMGEVSKKTEEMKVHVDRLGPMLTVNKQWYDVTSNEARFTISIKDEIGVSYLSANDISYLSVNEKEVPNPERMEVSFAETFLLDKPIEIIAKDSLRNQTSLKIVPPSSPYSASNSSSKLFACTNLITTNKFAQSISDNTPPIIEVRNLKDNQKIYVKGQSRNWYIINVDIKDDSEIKYLRINEGDILHKKGEYISFSYEIDLQNEYIIEAVDENDNRATVTIKPNDKKENSGVYSLNDPFIQSNMVASSGNLPYKTVVYERLEKQTPSLQQFSLPLPSIYDDSILYSVTSLMGGIDFIGQQDNSSIFVANKESHKELRHSEEVGEVFKLYNRLSFYAFPFFPTKRADKKDSIEFQKLLNNALQEIYCEGNEDYKRFYVFNKKMIEENDNISHKDKEFLLNTYIDLSWNSLEDKEDKKEHLKERDVLDTVRNLKEENEKDVRCIVIGEIFKGSARQIDSATIHKLKKLKGKAYLDETEFKIALKKTIGDMIFAYEKLILEEAKFDYQITQQSLNKLTQEKVYSKVIRELQVLGNGNVYKEKEDFEKILKEKITDDGEYVLYKKKIFGAAEGKYRLRPKEIGKLQRQRKVTEIKCNIYDTNERMNIDDIIFNAYDESKEKMTSEQILARIFSAAFPFRHGIDINNYDYDKKKIDIDIDDELLPQNSRLIVYDDNNKKIITHAWVQKRTASYNPPPILGLKPIKKCATE